MQTERVYMVSSRRLYTHVSQSGGSRSSRFDQFLLRNLVFPLATNGSLSRTSSRYLMMSSRKTRSSIYLESSSNVTLHMSWVHYFDSNCLEPSSQIGSGGARWRETRGGATRAIDVVTEAITKKKTKVHQRKSGFYGSLGTQVGSNFDVLCISYLEDLARKSVPVTFWTLAWLDCRKIFSDITSTHWCTFSLWWQVTRVHLIWVLLHSTHDFGRMIKK